MMRARAHARVHPGAWPPLILLAALGCAPAGEGTVVIDRAELWVGRAAAPPEAGPWQAVALPDRWDLARRRQATEGWYRARFDRPPAPEGRGTADAGERLALWLPRVYPNAEVFVNGERVGSGGRVARPPARNRYRPVLLPLRDGLVRERGNLLALRFVGTPATLGTLHPVWLGPEDALHARHALWSFLGVSLAQVAVVLAALLSLVAAQQALQRRGAEQGWFAGGLAAAVGSSIGLFTADVPLPSRLVVAWVAVCVHWAVLLFAIGVARAEGRRSPRAEAAWLGGYAATAAVAALLPPLYLPALFVLWWIPSGLLLIRMVRRLWGLAVGRGQRSFAVGLAAVAAMGLALLASTVAARNAALPADLGAVFLPWALVGVFGSLIGGQIQRAVRETRRANVELEARVAARERELAERYERIRRLERERVLSQERARITRDMHDGTGGQLASALAQVRSGHARPEDLERSLEDALFDLRLTMDSLRATAMDLPALLGLLRERVGRQARQHGMALAWEVSDAGEDHELPPDALLHVIRFVQEAVSNAVRHSGGRTLRVGSGRAPGQGGAPGLEVFVADDGRGGAAPREGGHGMANLRERARLLGGTLAIETGAAGTTLHLRFPVPGTEAAPEAGSVVGGDDAEL